MIQFVSILPINQKECLSRKDVAKTRHSLWYGVRSTESGKRILPLDAPNSPQDGDVNNSVQSGPGCSSGLGMMSQHSFTFWREWISPRGSCRCGACQLNLRVSPMDNQILTENKIPSRNTVYYGIQQTITHNMFVFPYRVNLMLYHCELLRTLCLTVALLLIQQFIKAWTWMNRAFYKTQQSLIALLIIYTPVDLHLLDTDSLWRPTPCSCTCLAKLRQLPYSSVVYQWIVGSMPRSVQVTRIACASLFLNSTVISRAIMLISSVCQEL